MTLYHDLDLSWFWFQGICSVYVRGQCSLGPDHQVLIWGETLYLYDRCGGLYCSTFRSGFPLLYFLDKNNGTCESCKNISKIILLSSDYKRFEIYNISYTKQLLGLLNKQSTCQFFIFKFPSFFFQEKNHLLVIYFSLKAVFFGLIIANIVGGIRLVLEFVYPTPSCGELDERPQILSKMNYLYFGVMLLFITASVIVVVSLLTSPRNPDEVNVLCVFL